MNTYRVNIKDTATGAGLGSVRVEASDKDAAVLEAKKKMVRHAKGFNAKYSNEGLQEWALRSENHDDYTAWGIRKMPAKVAA
jgi:hypothetical protein